MAAGETPRELREQRKQAYYCVLTQQDPAFSAALAGLYREIARIIEPFDRARFHWDLLDATHGGGEPREAIAAFREIVAGCERNAAGAEPDEAARWLQEAEGPRRVVAVLSAAEEFCDRWHLPRDGTGDIVDAYLSGDERLAPGVNAADEISRSIQLEPPAPALFFDDPTDARARAAPDWSIPYDPAPPEGNTRRDLDEWLERLFAYLRDQALAQATAIEAKLGPHPDGDGTRAPAHAALDAEARQLYLRLHQHRSWNDIAAELLTDPDSVQAMVTDWSEDLGIEGRLRGD